MFAVLASTLLIGPALLSPSLIKSCKVQESRDHAQCVCPDWCPLAQKPHLLCHLYVILQAQGWYPQTLAVRRPSPCWLHYRMWWWFFERCQSRPGSHPLGERCFQLCGDHRSGCSIESQIALSSSGCSVQWCLYTHASGSWTRGQWWVTHTGPAVVVVSLLNSHPLTCSSTKKLWSVSCWACSSEDPGTYAECRSCCSPQQTKVADPQQ